MTLTALNVDRTVSPSRNLLARKGAPVDSSVDEVVHLRLLCCGKGASAQQGIACSSAPPKLLP